MRLLRGPFVRKRSLEVLIARPRFWAIPVIEVWAGILGGPVTGGFGRSF